MTISDYVLDLALIGVVILQVRGRRLTLRAMILPVALVAWAAVTYLKAVPTAGNDLVLIGVLAATGTALGAASGLTTTVRRNAAGVLVAKAGAAAAGLWILGMGFRLAFQLYVTHGGTAALGRFSVAHHITSGQAWVAALVLMAIAEAVARTAVLAGRAWQQQPPAAHPSTAQQHAGQQPLPTRSASGIMAVGEHAA
ncbi:MAG TPA: hypothetical protein VFN68_01420 [Acidimicrobiales bacterium]|nr:hypothetical protein [Acidimicrobiales bacterium]